LPDLESIALSRLAAGQIDTVGQLTDQTADLLLHLTQLALIPGANILVKSRAVFVDTIRIQVDTHTTHVLLIP
jgi:Fe2+ transport system protein FeoA